MVAPARVARAPAARARPTGGVLVALPGPHSRNPPPGVTAILPAPSSATRGDHQIPRRCVTTGSTRQGTASASAARRAPDAYVRLLFADSLSKGTCQGRTVSRVILTERYRYRMRSHGRILEWGSRCRDGIRSHMVRRLPVPRGDRLSVRQPHSAPLGNPEARDSYSIVNMRAA